MHRKARTAKGFNYQQIFNFRTHGIFELMVSELCFLGAILGRAHFRGDRLLLAKCGWYAYVPWQTWARTSTSTMSTLYITVPPPEA